jgi:hypothetical protein
MSIKITIPNTSSDVLTFGSANTPTAAQIAGIDSGSSNGQLALYTTASGTSTERVRVDSSGNVGIGVTPSAWNSDYKPLQIGITSCVYGRVATNEAGLTQNLFRDTSGNFKYIGNGYAAVYAQLSGGGHAWFTAPNNSSGAGAALTITQAMTLDSSGNLLIGSTSGSLDGFGEKLFVSQNSNNAAFIASNTSASCISPAIIGVTADRNTTNNTFYPISYYNRGAANYKFRVADSGNVTNTNNSYGQISDIKLKENIVDATQKLEKLNQVRVVNFNFIGDQQKQLGVIAQELEQVFPSMVEESVDRDEEGNDLGTTTKSVKYSVFVPMLIKAIQEQQAIITQLQADVAALKGASA